MGYLLAYHTEIGSKKKTNQDSILVEQAMADGKQIVMAAVCDGMGGLEKGEVASATVVKSLAKWFREDFPGLLEGEDLGHQLCNSWQRITRNVHQKIYQYGKRNRLKLGTTLTAMLLVDEQYYIVHVGDCRVYEISSQAVQLTKDQTLVAREVERGNLTPEQAKTDRRRSVLLQCIGASEFMEPEFYKGKVKEDAVYLLCSDGFRHEISGQELFESFRPDAFASEKAMEQKLEKITKTVMERGERDNISSVLIHT